MLDIKDIRLNTEEYKRRLGTRGVKPEEIDELVNYAAKFNINVMKFLKLLLKQNETKKMLVNKFKQCVKLVLRSKNLMKN